MSELRTHSDSTHRRVLVVKATHCADDPERANLACNVASVGLASGQEVHLFLAVDGVRLALPSPPPMEVAQAPPIGDLLDAIYAAGTVIVCTPCATRRGLSAESFREGTVMAGSAHFLELATRHDATALIY